MAWSLIAMCLALMAFAGRTPTRPVAAQDQPTLPFPTLPPTDPLPTLPPDVPTPALVTPSPTTRPTQRPTATTTPTPRPPTPAPATSTPTATPDTGPRVFLPFTAQLYDFLGEPVARQRAGADESVLR